MSDSRPTEADFEAWRAEVDRTLKGADFDKRLVTRTLEGIEVQPLYTARDWPAQDDPGGFAGAPPYRRGLLPIGRHGDSRNIRPRYDQPDADRLREEIAADLGRGAKSLWLYFDGAARAGTANAGAPQGAHERGVPCLTSAQLGALLHDVPLQRVALSIDAGGNALAVTACLISAALQRGVMPAQLSGCLNADPLAALARDGALPFTLDSAREQMIALATFCAAQAPGLRAVTISAVHYHDAGAHVAQELGYALATGVQYVRWLCDAGLTLDKACAQLTFSFAVGSDFFMEIAKLRAMRQCWANAVSACGGSATDQACVIHATTSTRTKTQRDAWVNLLRETTEAFAAAAGGADSITTGGFDRVVGASDATARRLAVHTQVILDEESHVSQVSDPAGGAWYIEALTDRLAERAWSILQRVEKQGGMAKALCSGLVAQEVAEVAVIREAQIAKRKQAITGVSEFAKSGEEALKRAAPDWQQVNAQRSAALSAAARESLAKPLLDAKKADLRLVEAAIEVASRGASLGQLSCALAGAGEPLRIAALPRRRDAQAYEQLRDACDAYADKTGKRPSVFLCNLGKISDHKARAQFATGVFNAGGLSVLDNDGFERIDAAVEAFKRSGTMTAAICGSDEAYGLFAEALVPRLVASGATRVVLAGRPFDAEARYRTLGISDFIFTGCDVVTSLSTLLKALGVLS